MMSRGGRRWAATVLAVALSGAAQAEQPSNEAEAPARRLAESLADPELRARALEILERNPRLAMAEARARGAAREAVRMGALPDPTVGATAFLAPPETRVGPQRLMLALTQRWPAFGKLGLGEQAAALEASALAAEAQAIGLELVTEARRLWYEVAFVDQELAITDEFRRHLVQHEEIARTRYATGVGPGQGVVKLQAEITRVDSRRLELARRRVALLTAFAALADRPAADLTAAPGLPALGEPELDRAALARLAAAARPELAARRSRPDFTFGLTYTLVDFRDDLPGRLQPPPGNGDDVFGIQAGISVPLWRQSLRSGREAAREHRRAAEESDRAASRRVAAEVDDLVGRIPLGWRQLRLLEDSLILQAEEALDSARSGYVAGTLNALDLLDAEHVLFNARTAVARAAADYAIDLARLEGAAATALEGPAS